MRGPLSFGGGAAETEIRTRRFRCLSCRAVLVVGPPEALPYRLFSTVAIAWALALFGVERRSSIAVREVISPWGVVGAAAARTWQTLRRWLRAARKGRLVPGISAVGGAPREVAARLSHNLAAKAPPTFEGCCIAEQSVLGALHWMMGITPCAPAPVESTTEASF
jgi:hypothetical protein